MDVLQVIRAATSYLAEKNVENPRLNAEHLLAHCLNLRRLDLYLIFDRPVSEAERQPLRQLVRRRAAGEPLQYLLGEWDFFGIPLKLDSRVLIPRPETELLVELALKKLPTEPALTVLDVGTGSGAIALALAKNRPHWNILATDLSPDALQLARENAKRHNLEQKIQFVCCDLLPENCPKLDAIVANLPYIPSSQLPSLSREVQHEPPMALDGGADGLTLIRRLIQKAPSALLPCGCLFLEFGDEQQSGILGLLQAAGCAQIEIAKDLQGKPRIAFAKF